MRRDTARKIAAEATAVAAWADYVEAIDEAIASAWEAYDEAVAEATATAREAYDGAIANIATQDCLVE